MTRTRYALASLFQSFGLYRKNRRMTDAAFELHLMQDGEEILGRLCWPNVENIEEISVEYWSLRRIQREQNEIAEKLSEAEETLSGAQAERIAEAQTSGEADEHLLEERDQIYDLISEKNHERDDILNEAIATKRRYEALKIKEEVLVEEGRQQGNQYLECREELESLKNHFQNSKNEQLKIDKEIDDLEARLTQLEGEIDQSVEGKKKEQGGSYNHISQANRDISKYRSDYGLLEEEFAHLCRDVGHFLNLNSDRKDCREACRGSRGILEQLKLLRKSVVWNRSLVEKMSG